MREWINLFESLSELAIDKIITNFGPAIDKRLEKDQGLPANRGYNLDARGLINLCVASDPTPNSMYARRILQWWLKGEFRYFEDIGKAYDALKIYHAGKAKLTPDFRDIGRIATFADLYEISKSLSQEDLRSNNQKDRDEGEEYIKSGKAEIYYDSPEIKVVVPKTKEAAQYFGRNTQWCTSAKSNNQFGYYSYKGPLYIILFKKENKRWQFHFELAQFMDENDENIDAPLPENIFNLFPSSKWMRAINENGYIIEYITNPSEEMKKLAVSENGNVLNIIKNPSPDIIIIAVQKNPYLIQYVENPSEEIKKLAVQKNGHVIRYIKNPSEEMQKLAVQQNGNAIQHIINPSEEIQKLAVKEDGIAIQYIKYPSEEIKKIAVRNDSYAIQYIENPSEEIQKLAVQNDPYVIRFINNPSEEAKLLAKK